MALLWCDGFDINDTDILLQKYVMAVRSGIPGWVTGRLGGLALDMVGNNGGIFQESIITRYKLQPAVAEVVCGAAFSLRGGAGEWRLFSFYLGTEFQGALVATIQADTNYVRFKVVDANGATLETETGDFPSANFSFYPSAAWYFIEFKYLFDVAAGAFEVRINGVPEITSSIAYNTDPKGIGAFDRVACEWQSGSTPQVFLDDLYILDTSGARLNNFLAVDAGGIEVNAMRTDGAGAVQQWLDPEGYSQGQLRHDRLRAIAARGPVMIEGGTTERELYTWDNLTTINQQVLAVQMGLVGFRHQAESTVQVRGVYRQPSDGQVGTGSSVALGAGVENYRAVIFEENPVDSTLFDLTEINDGQFGWEVA